MIIVVGQLHQLDAFGLQTQPLERVLDIFQPPIGQFASADEMTLIIVAELTTEQQHSVNSPRQRIGDPDDVHGAQAAQGNDAHAGVVTGMVRPARSSAG